MQKSIKAPLWRTRELSPFELQPNGTLSQIQKFLSAKFIRQHVPQLAYLSQYPYTKKEMTVMLPPHKLGVAFFWVVDSVL